MSPTVDSPASPSGAKRGRPGYDQATVLRIAVETFTDVGYDATSMGMLADRLGISKSAIYHHVPSKVEILRMALDHALIPLEAVFDAPQASAGPAVDRLRFVMRSTLDVLFDRLPSVTLLLRLRGNSEVETDALVRRRALDRKVASIVELAQEEGAVRPDLKASTLARFIFGTINSITEWYRPGGGTSPQDAADSVVTLIVDGLRGRD